VYDLRHGLTPIYEGQTAFGVSNNLVILSSNGITVLNAQAEAVQRRVLRRSLRLAGTLEANETVQEARERIAREITLDQGMTIEWSGQYENQLRAQHTLLIIVPTVIGIIFLLLYVVYRSTKEAAHVILAVPFALTAAAAAQIDDGRHHRGGFASHHVEHQRRLGSNAPPGGASYRWDDQQPRSHPDCDPGLVRLAAGEGTEAGEGQPGIMFMAVWSPLCPSLPPR
jgi:hypothetical protein